MNNRKSKQVNHIFVVVVSITPFLYLLLSRLYSKRLVCVACQYAIRMPQYIHVIYNKNVYKYIHCQFVVHMKQVFIRHQ